MFPTNPAVTDGVEIFVWIVVVLISLVVLFQLLITDKLKRIKHQSL